MARGCKRKTDKCMYGHITEKDNGKFLVSFDFGIVEGSRKRESKQFNDYEEAADALHEHAKKRRQGKATIVKFTVEDMISRWIEHGITSKNWAITTQHGYNNILNNYFRPYLELQKVVLADAVTEELLHEYFVSLKEKEGLDNNTIIKHYDVLHGVFQYAVRLRRIDYNPVLSEFKPKKIERRQKMYSIEEEIKIRKAAEAINERLVIDIHIFMGERRSEGIGARWRDIDLERGVMRVEQARVRADGVEDCTRTKSKNSKRELMIPPLMMETLLLERKRQQEFKAMLGKELLDSDFVIVNRVCEPYHPSTINGIVVKLCERAGVENKGTHAFRRRFGTTSYKETKDIKAVAKALGDDVKTASEKYMLMDEDSNEEIIDAFSGHFERVMNGRALKRELRSTFSNDFMQTERQGVITRFNKQIIAIKPMHPSLFIRNKDL